MRVSNRWKFVTALFLALELPAPAADWRGFDRTNFTFEGHSAFVTRPAKAAPGNPWIWRTSFPDYHAEVDVALLGRGFHVAHADVVAMLGADAALDLMDRFYAQLTNTFRLAARPALEAVSRGGLHAYRYAARRPERIACLYADVPVMTLGSWPQGWPGAAKEVRDAMRYYGFKDAGELLAFRRNPLDLLEPIARARLPLRHVISLDDEVVPPEKNTLEARRRLRALGHDLEVIAVAHGTPESQRHHFPLPAVEETVAWIVEHASPDAPRGGAAAP